MEEALDKARHTLGTQRSFPGNNLAAAGWVKILPGSGSGSAPPPKPDLPPIPSLTPASPGSTHPHPCVSQPSEPRPFLTLGPWVLPLTAPPAQALVPPGSPGAGLCPEVEATEEEPSKPEHGPRGGRRLSGWAGHMTAPAPWMSRARSGLREVSGTDRRGQGGLGTLTLEGSLLAPERLATPELKTSSDDVGAWCPVTPGASLATPVGTPLGSHSHP